MVDELHGHVTAIKTTYDGASLTAGAASGATVIYVNDVADFDEKGGTLRVADSTGTFLAAVDYTAIDDDTDAITLATGLPSGVPDGAEVRILAADGTYAQTAEATVVDDNDGAPVTVDVLHALIPLLTNSVRAGIEESAVCTREGDGVKWTLVDVLGKQATAAVPHARRDRATSISITTNTDTVLTWDAFPATRGGIDVTSGVWTVPSDGRYSVSANVQFDGSVSTAGQRRIWFLLNGAWAGPAVRLDAASSGDTHLSVGGVLDLMQGDQLTVMVRQNSGGSINVLAGSTATVTGLD